MAQRSDRVKPKILIIALANSVTFQGMHIPPPLSKTPFLAKEKYQVLFSRRRTEEETFQHKGIKVLLVNGCSGDSVGQIPVPLKY
jgi:hypothetical protein